MARNRDRAEGTSLDVDGINDGLSALLGAYATVLEQVSDEPLVRVRRPINAASGKRGVCSGQPVPGLLRSPISYLLFPFRLLRNWWWGFSIRPIVKLFVETHINAKTADIGRFLKQERLKTTGGSESVARRLDECIKLIGYAESMVTGWSRLVVPLRFAPAAVMLLSWGVVGITGLTLLSMVMLVIALVPLLLLIVYPLVVRFGFRWKRAFLVAYPRDPSEGVDRVRPLEGEESPSIYELENRLHSRMGLKKHHEAALDLFLHPAPYWLLTSIVGILLAEAERGRTSTVMDLAVSIAMDVLIVGVFAALTWRVIMRHKRRKAAGLT
jgi:hypothetical protein